MIGGYLWGYLADQRGRRKVLVVSLAINGLFGGLASLAPWFWLFLLLRFISGIGYVCVCNLGSDDSATNQSSCLPSRIVCPHECVSVADFLHGFLLNAWVQDRVQVVFFFLSPSHYCRVGGSVPVIFSYFSEFMPRLRRGAMISCLATFWMGGNIVAAGGNTWHSWLHESEQNGAGCCILKWPVLKCIMYH